VAGRPIVPAVSVAVRDAHDNLSAG
jgi:hypothetical protein